MSVLVRAVACLAALALAVSARAQETGHGDVFGDLVHILRSPTTGQPILQKRSILLPGDLPGIAYCPIPIDVNGAEIPFLADSCEVDPTQAVRLIEVDYFGRLSGGRTREVNQRMHFDEVITTIIDSDVVTLEPGGRLQFGTDCTSMTLCAVWKVIDSPMENLAFYARIMKYGHIQTDPLEEDTSFHGDPAIGTVYHPALRAEDWAKLTSALTALLPRASASQCFSATSFVASCAAPQSLTAEDFVRAASFLGGASDKHGRMTVDLIQYLNRILKITLTTTLSAPTLNTLPALIRDENAVITEATPDLPAPANELFVDFEPAAYSRNDHFMVTLPAVVNSGVGIWTENPTLPLLPFLDYVFGTSPPSTGVTAFLTNAADAQRAIEFIHEYEIPADLYAVYAAVTYVSVASQTVLSSTSDQNVTLSATVTNNSAVNGGTVTFTIRRSDGLTVIGAPVVSGVSNGAASATYVLPGGTPPQTLQILAEYSGAFGFKPGSGMGTLTVSPDASVGVSVLNASTTEGTNTVSLMTFEVNLAAASTVPVTLQFATLSYSATSPSDYASRAGSISFAPGVTTATVVVSVASDDTAEPDESFSLVLSAPVNAVLVRAIATGLIVDDDGGDEPRLDFNQDGYADLAWRHATQGYVALWFMNGTSQLSGTLTDPVEVVSLDWEIRALGDFNGDWKPDMIWQHRITGALAAWFFDAAVRTGTTYLATIGGGVAEPDLNWKVKGAADMDRDGQLDLIWQNASTGELRIWHMNGTTQIDSVPITFSVAGTAWQVVAAADMDGDGWDDLVWRNPSTGGIAAWLMTDAQLRSTEWLAPAEVTEAAWRIVGARDMNGDGRCDLVWQHDGDGRLAVWLMNGLTMLSGFYLNPEAVADVNWKIVGAR